ncbi:MAG: PhzF family phenazine biosynthesis protein [Candidatus Bathyarchaeota archaeon]|nr:MAG: PhzF family phenazine biosynthesis protein [Candidatus Bathyarchaeota archaeon]
MYNVVATHFLHDVVNDLASNKFYLVDVFSKEKYAGNQLAVIRDVHQLSDIEMQRIAKEMNFSETTFIRSERPVRGGYDVRIFTPEKEIPFAGHPTLGTAYIIQQEILQKPVRSLLINLKIGQIPVTFRYSGERVLWMEQLSPSFGKTFDSTFLSRILNLTENDHDARFPIQEVSTGLPFIIVPLKTLKAVQNARIVRQAYFQLVQQSWAKAILVFCPETYHSENSLNVRVFADYYGVSEDPATGSGNGCLAGYLVKHRFFGGPRINLRVEQGYEIGRPSHIFLKARDDGTIEVFVGGSVVLVASGYLI